MNITRRQIIALDADGVLLDYNLAYGSAWERAFGVYPRVRDPNAYWALDRWDVERLSGERLEHFRACMDESFWESIPAMPGALEACHVLHEAGFELVCVSALEEKFGDARKRNLRNLGFPIEQVITTGIVGHGRSPKAKALEALKPVAFVDDYMPYMLGIDADMHLALIVRDANGSPNVGEGLRQVDSAHWSLLEFSRWWTTNSENKDMNQHIDSKDSNAVEPRIAVPDDFPRDPFPAALAGSQMKFAAREIDGRYVVGLTDDERQARFLMCSDLVEQLVGYAQRKQRERPDLTLPALLDSIDLSMRRKGWRLGGSEFDWIMVRLRAKFL